MLDKRTKEKLDALMEERKHNLCRHIYIIYRHMHEWSSKKWIEDGWEGIQPDHLRLISIVGAERMNNNELAKRARVSKQAMSKMVSFLEGHGFIEVNPDPNDSRAKIISVSKSGVEFMIYFNACTKDLSKQFIDIIGEKKTKVLNEIMGELSEAIIELHNRECGILAKK